MDVRLDTNNIPLQTPPPTSARGADVVAHESTPSVTISTREFPDIAGAEEGDAATEADVSTRDDRLGQLFHQAFSYAPPPMPNFL